MSRKSRFYPKALYLFKMKAEKIKVFNQIRRYCYFYALNIFIKTKMIYFKSSCLKYTFLSKSRKDQSCWSKSLKLLLLHIKHLAKNEKKMLKVILVISIKKCAILCQQVCYFMSKSVVFLSKSVLFYVNKCAISCQEMCYFFQEVCHFYQKVCYFMSTSVLFYVNKCAILCQQVWYFYQEVCYFYQKVCYFYQ